LIDDETRKANKLNNSKMPIKSQTEQNLSFSITESDKNSKSSKKPTNGDIIDDKENGAINVNNESVISKLSFDAVESNSFIKKRKNKVKTIREELENNSLETNENNNIKEYRNFNKKEKQNEYSSEFIKLQNRNE
jgi:hypothetical protein